MKRFQHLWEGMLDVALYGMNIGPASHPHDSGEIFLLGSLRKILGKPGDAIVTIFDVGANIGGYARVAAAILGPDVRILSFEPSSTAYEKLRGNTREMASITVFQNGFSDAVETLELFSDSAGSGLASVYDRRLSHHGLVMENRETVHLSTLDRFCRENNIGTIHLLKVDVEGHEFNVFAGASEMIDRDAVDVIQFEFGGCNIDSRTYFQDFFYLLNPKYHLFRLTVDGMIAMDRYHEKFEQFQTTNFVAIHRKLTFLKIP